MNQCALCGCQDQQSLVYIQETKKYVCNGRGKMHDSHAIFYLKKTGLDSFCLPSSTQPLECSCCKAKDVFSLQFYENDKKKLTFICSKCKSREPQAPYEYHHLITNGLINTGIVKTPNDHKQVTGRDALASMQYDLLELGLVKDEDVNDDLEKMKYIFDSPSEYCKIMKPIIKAEMEKVRIMLFNNVFRKVKVDWTDPKHFTVKRSGEISRCLKPLANFQITKNRFKENSHIEEASIIHRGNKIVEFSVTGDESKLIQNETLSFRVKSNLFLFGNQFDSMDIFERMYSSTFNGKAIAQAILGQVNCPSFEVNNKAAQIVFSEVRKEGFPTLNRSQREAVRAALTHHFTFIQGPPGTGKTTVLANIAKSFVDAGMKPVLICAPSNLVTDFCAMKIRAAGMNVVRAYSHSISTLIQRGEELDHIIPGYNSEEYDLNIIAKNNVKKAQPKIDKDLIHGLVDIEKNRIINEVDVICSTISSSSFIDRKFKVVIIDEAGQASDNLLIQGAVKCEDRLILVGDHKQIGPIVNSIRAQKAGLNTSLLLRLMYDGLVPQMLTKQYRMHPALIKFPSKEFYFDKVKSGVKAKDRQFSSAPLPFPNTSVPMIFWNIESEEIRMGSSYYNHNEVLAIAEIVDRLCESKIDASDIGIISPYYLQSSYIIKKLDELCKIAKSQYIDDIEVASVDGFQGREKEIIILSLVRSNSNNDVGFLKDETRLNVSLTRAKRGLVIVGNAETFAKCKPIRDLMDWAMDQGILVSGDLDNFTPFTGFKISGDADENPMEII